MSYSTTTSEIIRKYETVKNPVTRWVYREIIGNRIDRCEKNTKGGTKTKAPVRRKAL